MITTLEHPVKKILDQIVSFFFKDVDDSPDKPYKYPNADFMVTVVQLVERQIVVLVVVGSSPIGHPIYIATFSGREHD